MNKQLFLNAGDLFDTGTCPGLYSANGTGDTYLRLYGPNGLPAATSDDNCATGSNSSLSAITGFSVPPEAAGAYELRAGCFGGTTCSGLVAFSIR